MRNERLESTLREYFREMVDRYKWLKIKFEYSEMRDVYLVSYSPSLKIEESESFMKESMDFEDRLDSLYGNYAPLFCDDEKYFKISPNAEVFENRENKEYICIDVDVPMSYEYEDKHISWDAIDSWQMLDNIDNYQIAA